MKEQSIQAIELEIAKLKEAKPKTKRVKAEIEKKKSELNKLYAENKKRIMEFEKANFEFLAMLRSTNNFYKMFGHSALYYAYSIAPKLSLNVNLMSDKDFTARCEDGFVSVASLEKTEEVLKTLNIKIVKTKKRNGDFVIFKLPWKFTEEQLADFKEHNITKNQKFPLVS